MADAPIIPEVTPAATASAVQSESVSGGAVATAIPVAEQAAPEVTEAPALEVKAEEPKAAPTMLSVDPVKTDEAVKIDTVTKSEDKTPEIKANDKPVELKKEEGVQSEKPAQAPTYEAFVFPEGVKLDEGALGEFTKDLGEFETVSKADHAEVQKLGQKFLDKYIAESEKNTQRITEYYQNEWNKQKIEWRAALEADPEIGGNRIQTTKASIVKALSKAPAEHVQAFTNYMESSGIGDNPAVVRMFAYLSDKLNAYEQETARPIAGTKPPQPKSSIYETFYGKKSG